MDFAFVILRCVRSADQNRLWKRAVASVREFYPTQQIVVIDDNSTHADPVPSEDGIVVIQSEFPGAGEALPYYYFLKHRWAERMVFLHDSMFLKRCFKEHELLPRNRFLWHFDIHRWDDNAIINRIMETPELIAYNANKNLWHGCFGAAMIVSYDTLLAIENRYGTIQRCIERIRTRHERMAFERILAILMFKEGVVSLGACSINGLIFRHPRAFFPITEEEMDRYKRSYHGLCMKEWIGR